MTINIIYVIIISMVERSHAVPAREGGKLDFLIHPYYKQAISGEASEHEEEVAQRWRETVDQIADDDRRVMVILASSTKEELLEGAPDTDIVTYAEKTLGERCITIPYIEEELSVYGGIIEEELQQRFDVSPEDIKNLSSSAFGEYAEVCVVQIADDLNRSVGLQKKTQVQPSKSLSIHGDTDRVSVHSEVRRVKNSLHLSGVTVRG